MRCRFCDTEIAAKALICYRCGRATTDARVAPPPVKRGLPAAVAAAVVLASGAAAAFLPDVVQGPEGGGGAAPRGRCGRRGRGVVAGPPLGRRDLVRLLARPGATGL